MREIEQMHSLLFLSKFIHPINSQMVRFTDKRIVSQYINLKNNFQISTLFLNPRSF